MTKDPVAKAETKRSPKRNPKATAEAVSVPEVVADPAPRATHTWPHDDVRAMVRTARMLQTNNVAMLLLCGGCEQSLKLEGRDAGGASLMGCKCAVRRWL